MGKTLKSRLVAYQANGSKLGLLPEPTSYTVSFTHDAVGALTVSYSRKALRGEILDRRLETGLEIAVEVSDGGRWIEPYNGRFVIASRSRNALDVSDTVSLTGVSYGWLLKKALNLDTSRLETKGDEKGTRKFANANANAGTIMRTFMDENWNRGGVKVDCSRFTSGADSAGKQWGYMLPSIYYDLGVSIQDVLDSLVNNGLCDWRTDARQLLLWNADGVAVCRDLSKSCVVTLAQDVSEAPDDESIDGLASSILVRGDNINFRQDNPNAPKPWGGWELYSSQQGVNKKETAEHLIKPTLANAARVRGQYTRSVNVVEASCLPLIDYTIGDWITAPTVANREKVRVQQVTLQLDSTGFKASLILNDKNYDSSVRLTKRMNGITGGAHLGGASGAIPAPEKDHRVPKAPQNLSANSDAYINVNGYARGMVTARWDDVTLATDGTAMDITSYAVEYRVNKTGHEWHSAGTTTEHTLSWSNLDCGVQILIRVRAIPSYSDQMGEWSSVFALTVAKDTTPPPVPSKPILSSELGVVSVAWDGKTADGGSMPIDWDRNILGERLADGGFREIAAVATGIGDYVITGLTAGSSHTYAFRAVDHAGNRSDWSAVASVTVASAVSPDEVKQIQQDLADNKTALKDNTAKLTQAQKDIQSNKSNLDAANQTLAQAKTDLSQAQKDIAQAKSDLTTANGEISKAKESAAQAYAEAHSKNHTFRGPDEPKDNLIVGDLWLKTQKYWTRWKGEKNNSPSLLADFYTYWTGAPNNSPSVLVPLSDRVVEVLTWDGTRFEPFDLVANNILASGTVAAKHLAADSVTAEKVKANAITADKLAANSVTTEKLVSDAVTAGKLAADSVQARNIVALAITSDKIAANSVTTAKLKVTEDMTVALLNVHKIQAGEIAANAVTTAALAAGAVDADKLAANSVNASKIVTGAITADKLAANSVTAVKIAAGTITSDKVAAGQFKGYVFTGAIFQSSEAANTGMKLNSTALQMWDSSHNQTVYLDGEGKNNVLTGTFQTRNSGHRVRISPDFRTHTIGGAETFDGDGLEFPAYKGSTAYFVSPTITSQISSNQVGEMGGMELWSGRIAQHDPGSYLRLRSTPRKRGGTGSGGVTSHVSAAADTDYDEPDIGKKSRALLNLTGDANAGSSVWLEAEDGNGSVGVGANIGTGYVYLGGYLGGITNRFTFQAQAAWKAWYPNPGQSIANGAAMQVNCTFSPTKYGHYYVVANADSQWAGIIAHPCNTGGQSGFQLKLYNADQPCPVDIYAEFLAYLVK